MQSQNLSHYREKTRTVVDGKAEIGSTLTAIGTSSRWSSGDSPKATPQVDLSMKYQARLLSAGPAPFKIVNLGMNGSAFVFEGGGNVLTHIGDTDHGDFGLWVGYQTGGDKYIIKNIGLNAWVSVEKETGRLAVLPGVGAVEFAVESAGHNVWVIKEPFEDLLWEAVYEGTSMRFGYVTLRKSPGSRPGYQHWTFSR
ncbi:hypothetical protein B0H13DRAFT_2535766 [Mycena leptocephala]|nr:hypothetical protein B0H13DRAFT_2535766 [Mycena leptocephala]